MKERNRGSWTCEVCGREFALMHEDRYTARNSGVSALYAAFMNAPEPTLWDAFDCPYCGCQNRVAERKRRAETDDRDEEDEDGTSSGDTYLMCPFGSVCDEGVQDE